MASKDLSQLDLPLARRPQRADVDMGLVLKQPTKLGALNLCIQLSGLEDKEIYSALEIDAGQWTRIKKGEAHFPDNKESALMRLCGNTVPLMWAAAKEGYLLQPMQTELEAQVADLTRQVSERDQKLATITEFMRETGRA
jgi:hypothetical protein